MTELKPTSQQVLVWSSELRRMMKSDAFTYAVQLMRQDYQNRFFSSKPDDRAGREQAYNRNAALDDLLSAMQTVILVAEYTPEDEG